MAIEIIVAVEVVPSIEVVSSVEIASSIVEAIIAGRGRSLTGRAEEVAQLIGIRAAARSVEGLLKPRAARSELAGRSTIAGTLGRSIAEVATGRRGTVVGGAVDAIASARSGTAAGPRAAGSCSSASSAARTRERLGQGNSQYQAQHTGDQCNALHVIPLLGCELQRCWAAIGCRSLNRKPSSRPPDEGPEQCKADRGRL